MGCRRVIWRMIAIYKKLTYVNNQQLTNKNAKT